MKESIFVDRLGKPVLRVLNQVARRFEASPKASFVLVCFFFNLLLSSGKQGGQGFWESNSSVGPALVPAHKLTQNRKTKPRRTHKRN